MDEIRQRGSPADIAWHLVDCSFVDYYRSNYRPAHRNALAALGTLMNGDDANTYLNFAVAHWNCDLIVPWSLNLLGEWGGALRELEMRIARAERNADVHRVRLLLLNRTRVQLNAMDFASARATALSLLPELPRQMDDPLRRMCLVILGAAEATLGNHEDALQHLLTARAEMDQQLVIVDWYNRLMLQWALTNLWLDRGDLDRAREEGARFIEHASATAEQTWRALAWEANARIALASGDLRTAREHADQALATLEGVEAPVAGWQAHATAAAVARAGGDMAIAAHHGAKSRELVLALAASLASNEGPRHTFLTAPEVRRALGEDVSAPRFSAESFNNQTETVR
jgi:tetratricopeptide (TPR) repeat protein